MIADTLTDPVTVLLVSAALALVGTVIFLRRQFLKEDQAQEKKMEEYGRRFGEMLDTTRICPTCHGAGRITKGEEVCSPD